jgi:hypothetical protein
MSGDKHLAVVRHEAQLFDAAHTGLSRMGETPIREIQKAALKDSQADDRQGIDCHEKGQRPFQPIFPLSPKSSLAGWLDGLSASIDQIAAASSRPFRNFVGPDPKAREGIGAERCCDRYIRRIPSPGQ